METVNQADRMAIAKALALIQYIDNCPTLLAMFVLQESDEFREASESIRAVANASVDKPECNTCFGTGQINGGLGPMVRCGMCNGSGRH